MQNHTVYLIAPLMSMWSQFILNFNLVAFFSILETSTLPQAQYLQYPNPNITRCSTASQTQISLLTVSIAY